MEVRNKHPNNEEENCLPGNKNGTWRAANKKPMTYRSKRNNIKEGKMINLTERIKRISAGIVAGVVAITGIVLVHNQAVRAADLALVDGVEIPFAEITPLSSPITEDPYNAGNYKTAITNTYYYAGKPFAIIGSTEDDGNTQYFMAQSSDWGTSAWNEVANGDPAYIVNATQTVVNAATDDKEKAIAKETHVTNNDDGGDYGYRMSLDDSKEKGLDAKYYPIAIGDVIYNNSGTPTIKEGFASILSNIGNDFWTRTAIKEDSAFYVSSTGVVTPTPGLNITDPTYNATNGNTHYMSKTNLIVPAFRADMTKVYAELPAVEYPSTTAEDYLEPSYTLKKYFVNPGDLHTDVKFLVKSTGDNSLQTTIKNQEITNVYENGAFLIEYWGAKVPNDGNSKFISAMIFDEDGKALYYGRLDTITTKKGVVQINTPRELTAEAEKTYTLAIFEETDYGQYKTGGMSNPCYAKFTVKPERTDLGITMTSSDEHVKNINNSTMGTIPFYFGGKQFYFGQVNADNTVMLIAKDPDQWGSRMAWDANSIIAAMKSEMTSGPFNDTEKTLIKDVKIYKSKSDSAGDVKDSDTVKLYPITKTMIEKIKTGTPTTQLFERGDEFWTGSYRNASKAYYVDIDGDIQEAEMTATKYVLPAFNLDLSGIVAEVEYKGEKNANVSYANELSRYNVNEHTDGARFILKDESFNDAIAFDMDSLDENYTAGQEFTVDYVGASEYISSTGENTASATYIDGLLYDSEKDTIKYFGRLAKLTAANGTVNVKIPASISRGDYRLAFMVEKVNGDGQSNISTDPKESMKAIKIVTSDPTGMHTVSSESADVHKPTAGVSDNTAKEGIRKTLSSSQIISMGNHDYIKYKENGDGSYLTLIKDGKDETTEVMWAQSTSDLDNGQPILDITATDFPDSEFTEAELKAIIPQNIDTDTGSGTKNDVKIYVPSFDELKAADGYIGDESTDTNATNGYDTKYDLLKAAGAEDGELLWTRTYAGSNNAYYISSVYTMNGTSDLKNTQQSLHYIPAATIDPTKAAFMAGDATEGKNASTSPLPGAYNVASFGTNVKPYFIKDGVTINFPGLNGNIRNSRMGVTYTIPYKNASVSSDNGHYISAAIFESTIAEYDSNTGKGNIVYYGKLAKITEEIGYFDFTIPTGLDPTTKKYVVAFFEEEAHDPFVANDISDPVYLVLDNLNSTYPYFYEIADKDGITFDNISISKASESAEWVWDAGDNKLQVFTPHAVVYDERKSPEEYRHVPESYYTVKFYTDSKCTTPTPEYQIKNGIGQTVDFKREGETVPLTSGTYYAKFNLTNEGKIENNETRGYADGDDPTIVPFFVTESIDLTDGSVTLTIGDKDYSGDKDNQLEYEYTGETYKPAVVISISNNVLKSLEDVKDTSEPEDYEVLYANNTEVGTAIVSINGLHSYSGTITKHFLIRPKSMEPYISASDVNVPYDGQNHNINVVISNPTIRSQAKVTMSCNGVTPFTGATDAGTYNVNWSVTHESYDPVVSSNKIVITRRDASGAVITLSSNSYPYTAGPIEPEITSVVVDGISVSANEYSVEWTDNINVGTNTATGTFTFNKNFSGTATKTFTITPLRLDDLTDSEITCAAQTYDGENKTPRVKINGTDITDTGEYTFTYKDSGNNTVAHPINAGTYTVTVTSTNPNITGSKDVEFKVLPIEMIDGESGNISIVSKNSVTYTGQPITDVIQSVSYKADGGNILLTAGTDYDVAYSNNTEAGTGTATITFKGNYHAASPVVRNFKITAGTIQPGTVTTINTTYDGQQHKPVIECVSPNGVTITYAIRTLADGDTEGVQPTADKFQETIPNDALIAAGNYEVWYKMSKINYDDVCDYTRVSIEPKSMDSGINIENIDVAYDLDPHPFTEACITLTGEAQGSAVTYSTSENGVYSASIPDYSGEGAYTAPGVYNVWCKFTKTNYKANPVHATVTIREVSIPYSISGNKTYNYDGEMHYITCTPKVPDTTAEYSINSDYSDSTTTALGFDEVGTHTVYIRLQRSGYENTEFSVQMTINPIPMEVEVVGYSGPYDAKSHSITFNFTKPDASKANIQFSEDGTTYTDTVPFKTNAGRYPIYYKIESSGYITEGENPSKYVEINITALDSAAEGYGYDGAWDGEYHSPTVVVSRPTTNYTIKYSEDDGATWDTEVPAYKDPGTYNVKWLLEENNGNYNPLSGDIVIKIGPRSDIVITNLDVNRNFDDQVKEKLAGTSSTKVTIASDVGPGITGEAFTNADSAQTIRVEDGNEYYSSANGALYDSTGDKLIAVPNGKVLNTDLVNAILSGVSTIGDSAFENCNSLSGTLTIPSTVDGMVIEEDAFKKTGISKVVIPNNVDSIGSGAFEDCKSLKVVTIDGDPDIEKGAFTGCGVTSAIYANSGKTLAYVPSNINVSNGTYNINSANIKKVAGGAFTDNDHINTIKITGNKVVTFAEDSINSDVEILVPNSLYESMKERNPKLANQMTAYKTDISNATVNLEEQGRTYKIGTDGTMPTPVIESIVLPDGTELTEDTDYEYEYTYDLKSGLITVTGKGDYTGSTTKKFNFVKTGQLIVDTTTTMDGDEFSNGDESTGLHTNKETLANVLDSSVDSDTKEEALTTNIVVRMKYDENIKTVDREKILALLEQLGYSNIAKMFNLTVFTEDEDGNKTNISHLSAPVSFNMEMPEECKNTNNIGVVTVHNGTAKEIASTATTTNIGFNSADYSAFAIVYAAPGIDETKFTATIPATTYTYTGAAIEPEVTVKYDGTALTKDTHYTVAYADNTEPGTATVTVTGKGDYAGITRTINFTIKKEATKDTNLFVATIPASSYTYTGKAITPTVTVKYDGATLTKDTDYTVEYANNVNQGLATITVKGTGEYAGITKTIDFAITGSGGGSGDIGNVTCTLVGASEYTYTGSAITPDVYVMDAGKLLTLGTDYSLYYQDNVETGTAKIVVSGLNTYVGFRKELAFTITPKNIAATDVKVSGIDDEKKYTGNSITQSPTIKYNGKKLKKGTDYTITYSNNKKVGTATMTITGINNFTGTLEYEFDIVKSDDDEKSSNGTSTKNLSDIKLTDDGRLPVAVSGNLGLTNAKVTNGSSGYGGSPKTNDQGTVPVVIGIILMVAAAVVAGIMAIKKRKSL